MEKKNSFSVINMFLKDSFLPQANENVFFICLWLILLHFLKHTRLFILPHIIPIEVATIHGNIHSSR